MPDVARGGGAPAPPPRLNDPSDALPAGLRTGLRSPVVRDGRIVEPVAGPEPERRFAEVEPGKFVEAIVGYRSWRHEASGGSVSLISYTSRFLWTPHTNVAVCRCHHIHGCGLYAWTRVQRVGSLGDLISGEILMWGDVTVHELGLRATHAKVSALHVYPLPDPTVTLPWAQRLRTHRLVTELAALQYGVPVVQR